MNFDLGPDELALKEGIRDLCRGRFPIERVRELATLDRGLWRELGEAGVFALRLPEDDGGIGAGMTQAVVVFEELGAALVPGPLVASHLAAGHVQGAATGERIVGLLEARGELAVVEHLESLDQILAFRDDTVLETSPLPGRPLPRPLDPLTPVHLVEGVFAGLSLDADPHRLWLEGACLTAALLLGIAARTTEMAVAYAKEREQFGRPIGSFQAVKHLCADMLVRAEMARAAVYAAGVMIDDPEVGDAERAVRGAKLMASEAAVTNGKTCVQVHGGMGFTWEVDVHLYLKRAAVLATHFGGADVHAEAMAGYL